MGFFSFMLDQKTVSVVAAQYQRFQYYITITENTMDL